MAAFKTVTDMMGRTIEIPAQPKRVVSIVPSQTELLFDLNLEEQICGITKFCIHPQDKFKSTFKVGGTKDVYLERLRDLQPDLIIGNKEENDAKNLEPIMDEFPVWMSEIYTLEDSYRMMKSMGEIFDKQAQVDQMIQSISAGFNNLPKLKTPKKVAYLIWNNPIMVAGHHTFIDHLLGQCGMTNIFSGPNYQASRYPEVTADLLAEKQPDLIFLSSEPFPFKEKHLKEFKSLCAFADVKLVDGELFSWYGSRLMLTPSYLEKLIKEIE